MGSAPPAEPAPGASAGGELLVVYELRGGAWGWCYRNLDDRFELHSNLTFRSREEAVVSARRAYPDVPFAPDGEPAGR